MPPAPDSQPLSLVPRVGGPSSPPWGGGWVCLGSPRSSLANLALVFSLLLLSLASKSQLVRMCVCVCVCLSLSLLPLHVFVSFCLVLSVRAPLSCPAPFYSQGGSPTLPPSQLCVITSIIPGLHRTDTSQAPTLPSFPLFAQLWQHSVLPPCSLETPKAAPHNPAAGRLCAVCVVRPIPPPGGRHRPIPTNPPCRPLRMEPDLLAQRSAPMAAPLCHPGHMGHWPQAGEEGACIH